LQACIGAFDSRLLGFPWINPDTRVDSLQLAVQELVAQAEAQGLTRREIFARIWGLAHAALGMDAPEMADTGVGASIPHLSEPWYCCAEPTEQQLQNF
jgi:hypothetical protein